MLRYEIKNESLKNYGKSLTQMSLTADKNESLMNSGLFNEDPVINRMIYGYLVMAKLNTEISDEYAGLESQAAQRLDEELNKSNFKL